MHLLPLVSSQSVRSARPLLATLALVSLAACRVGPDYTPPELDVPDAWHNAAVAGIEGGEGDLSHWWTVFEDPVLDDLVARARNENLDLRIAAQRVREARALRRISAADRVPTVDAVGDVRRQDFSDEIVGPVAGSTKNAYLLAAEASWELDVWGRIARSVNSAEAEIQASVEDYRDVLVLLYAEVALAYVDVRTNQERILLAQANIESQRGTLQLTRDRFNAQIAPELDVRQAELNLARTESAIPALRILLTRSQNRLAVLLGVHPGSLDEVLGTSSGIPDAPASLAAAIPADALRNRPDLRAAERRLAAQVERIGVATAELYPAFGLSGRFGFDAADGASLFSSSASTWAIGIPFRWNVFDRGRILGNIEIQEARAEALQTDYERTVLGALEEVENALVGFGQGGLRSEALSRSVLAAQQSRELVQTLYKTGLTNFQNVLDMERTLASEQDSLAATRGERIVELIRLYRALGGGWDTMDPDDTLLADEPMEAAEAEGS